QGNVARELQRTACFVCEKHPVELCNILVYFIYPTRIHLVLLLIRLIIMGGE
ncbi:hypothetical protein S83_035775, partial [Arachis hypogaea]